MVPRLAMIGCLEDFVPHSAMTSMTLQWICPSFQSGHVVRVEYGYHVAIGRTAQVLILKLVFTMSTTIPCQTMFSNTVPQFFSQWVQRFCPKIFDFQSINYMHPFTVFNFRTLCCVEGLYKTVLKVFVYSAQCGRCI